MADLTANSATPQLLNSYLTVIEDYSQKIQSILKTDFNGKYELNASMLVQQSQFLKNELSKQTKTESVEDILVVPTRYSRKTDRKYKLKKFGAMTDKKVLDFYDKSQVELAKIEEEKIKRKEERELKKAIKLNEMKIKKEKLDAKNQKNEKASKIEPRKLRGRPRKNLNT